MVAKNEMGAVDVRMMINQATTKIAVAEDMVFTEVPATLATATVPAAALRTAVCPLPPCPVPSPCPPPLCALLPCPLPPCPPPCPRPCAVKSPPEKGPRSKVAQNTTARAALFRGSANILTDSIFMPVRHGTSKCHVHVSVLLNMGFPSGPI